MMMGSISQGRRQGREGGAFSHFAILAVLLMVFALLMLALMTFGGMGFLEGDDLVYLTFGLNLAFGLTCFVVEVARRPFSIMQVHWVFYLTFFVIAPLSQYVHGYSPWGYTLLDADYLLTNALLLVWGVLFAVGSMRFYGGSRRSYEGFSNEFFSSLPQVTTRAMRVLLLLSFGATVLEVWLVGFTNLFSRYTFTAGLDQTASLIFDKGVRSIPVFVFVFAVVRCKQRGSFDVLAAISLALLLVAAFPAGMSRYNAATIYGGIALLAFAPLMVRKGAFPLLFLLALLVIFPASNVYRTNAFGLAVFFNQVGLTVSNLSLGFCAGDYDAYSMFARALHYVSNNGAAGGYQLLTALLFFVPRAFWAAKGVGTGSMVASAQGQAFVNVSCPLPGEAVVNFGIPGIILFAIVLGFLCRKFDDYFYEGFGGGACLLRVRVHALFLHASWRLTQQLGVHCRLFHVLRRAPIRLLAVLCGAGRRQVTHVSTVCSSRLYRCQFGCCGAPRLAWGVLSGVAHD